MAAQRPSMRTLRRCAGRQGVDTRTRAGFYSWNKKKAPRHKDEGLTLVLL